MLEGSLHILHKLISFHNAGNFDDSCQHGRVGEVLAQFLLKDLPLQKSAAKR